MSLGIPPRPGTGLSEKLKQLEKAQGPLHLPGFDVDTIVRGGRRRRRRRTIAGTALAVAAVVSITAVVGLPSLSPQRTPIYVPAVSAPANPSPSTSVEPVNLSDESLKFAKAGNTVTVSDKGRRVATMALSSAVYTKTSGHVVFAVTGQQPLLLDTSLFIVYDSFGGENTATRSAMLRLGAGAHTVTLDYQLVNRAEAVGWAPSNGEATWAKTTS